MIALPEFSEEVAEGIGLGSDFGVTAIGVLGLLEDVGGGESPVFGVGAEQDFCIFADRFGGVVGVGMDKVVEEVGFGEAGVFGEEVIGEFAPAAEGGGVGDRF